MRILNKQRPNTAVDEVFLSENIILCCGEDWHELLIALRAVTSELPALHHEYRSYRFSRFRRFSLVWTGIGTGCLEPLLYELHNVSVIENIVLIGTAGATSTSRIELGRVYVLQEAFLGGAAVQLSDPLIPLRPRFAAARLAVTQLASASIASTDYYYGFSTQPGSDKLREADSNLRKAVDVLCDKVDLIDMETAQFYYFCEKLFDTRRVSYVGLKGAANAVSEPTSQTSNSLAVLEKALAASFTLLDLQPETVSSRQLEGHSGARQPEGSISKLMEEVKLFWTIQIAVCGVLGYLGTNLTLALPPASVASALSTTQVSPVYLKNFSIAIISFFLIQIGAIYNLIGNYYARIAAAGSALALLQENRITPTLGVFYLVISAAIAALGARTGIPNVSAQSVIFAAVTGLCLNFFVCRIFVYQALARGHEDYKRYARPFRIVYNFVTAIGIAIAVGYYLSTLIWR